MNFIFDVPKQFLLNIKKTTISFLYLNNSFDWIFFQKVQLNNRLLLSPSTLKPLYNYLLDILSNVILYMEIVGFNYKINYIKNEQKIFFFIGYTNIVIFFHSVDIILKILDKKNKIYSLQNKNRLVLIPFALQLRSFKAPNIYTGHGIRFYKEILKFKQIKK